MTSFDKLRLRYTLFSIGTFYQVCALFRCVVDLLEITAAGLKRPSVPNFLAGSLWRKKSAQSYFFQNFFEREFLLQTFDWVWELFL